MKKLLLVLAALLVVNGAFSQDVKFGIKAGLNLAGVSPVEMSVSGVTVKMFENDGMNVGFHFGAFANVGLNEKFAFQPELLFSTQGGKQKPNSLLDMGNAKVSYKFNYLLIPLLLEFKPVDKLGILLGPQLGFNVSRSATSTLDGEKETISGSDFDDAFTGDNGEKILKNFDASLAIGLQYALAEKVTIGARFNLGLTNSLSYSTTEEGMKISEKGWKNNVFQIGIAYSF